MLSTLYRWLVLGYSGLPYHLAPAGSFAPLQSIIEITYRCNLRCRVCQFKECRPDSGGPQQPLADELSDEELAAAVRSLPRRTIVSYSGGEPFLRPGFLELLERTAAQRRVHVFTNGTLLDEQIARRLTALAPPSPVNRGLLGISVSLQGTREVHNQLTASNSFERVVDGVRALCSARGERRWPLLELKVVVARENAGHLLALREIAAELQVDVFNVIAENHLPHLDRLTGTVRSLEQTPPFPAGVDASLLKKTLHTLFRQQGRPVLRLTPQWLPAEVFADHYRGLFDRTLFECRAPWYFAGITATGEVYACPYIRLGNVKQTPLAALFRGETIRQFRRALKERRIYAGCAGCCFLVYRPRRGRHGAIPVGTGAMEQLGSPPAAASLAQSRREAGPARASLLAPEDSRR